ncbi:EutN/CcmL family microcompartment protein [Sporofaciens musculi]|jgi:ethanolamine utilization protein EutN|uniref:EutN/CcmL family microcompartment protein n=1 Tax=Sporofaciens musculi TaxID=2681861 RepID=UPI00216CB09B|nr:EutN/CcmL family microcompartment protein [Sporofaciens musculi]MCI9226428.1 EutN/CcmL family microcompartment protein [Dorea sp.]
MLIAKVVGNVVSTQKHEDYRGHKLLIVRQVGTDGEFCGPEMITVDGADGDAGVGDMVLVIQEGGGARHAARCDHPGPIDLCVIAVVDMINIPHQEFIQ